MAVLTYDQYIQIDANTPKEEKPSVLQLKHNSENGWYKLFGWWNGERIIIDAPDFNRLREATKRKHNLEIPRMKEFIFTHSFKHRRYAIMQGFIPGYSCMVDVSNMVVKNPK